MSGRFRRRFGSNYGRRSFSRNRFSRFGSSTAIARRARGNSRAANQQADSTNVVINLMHKTSAGCACLVKGDTAANARVMANIGTAAINIFDLLAKSEFFSCYAPMYDQFRITSIKVKVTPVKWSTYDQRLSMVNGTRLDNAPGAIVTPVEGQDNTVYVPEHLKSTVISNTQKFIYPQGLTIVTAWDRTGLDTAQVYHPKENANSADDIEVGVHYDDNENEWAVDDVDNINANNVDYLPFVSETSSQVEREQAYKCFYTNIGDNITTYSSAQTKQLLGGSSFNLVRYLYPSSQQEKSQYFSTSDLIKTYKRNIDNYAYEYIPADPDNDNAGIIEGESTDLTSLLSTPSIPFKPTFLIGVLGSNDLQMHPSATADEWYVSNQISPVTFNLEFDIGVTFRGLRKAQVV